MKRKLEDWALIEHYLGDGLGYCRETGPAFRCDLYGCRVLVSKERLGQKWPTEADGPEGEAFRKFAARLADAVQRALAEGKKIGTPTSGACCCPLGCLPEVGKRFPGMLDAPDDEEWAWASFYLAFDGRGHQIGRPDAYARLGFEYRKRFVTKEQ
jgi:hypothetical protein